MTQGSNDTRTEEHVPVSLVYRLKKKKRKEEEEEEEEKSFLAYTFFFLPACV